jgi:hypothetical protein
MEEISENFNLLDDGFGGFHYNRRKVWRQRRRRLSLLRFSAANVNGRTIQLRKTGGILRKSLNLVSIVLLTVSTPFIKKQKSSEVISKCEPKVRVGFERFQVIDFRVLSRIFLGQ